jgi:hypothetical protein
LSGSEKPHNNAIIFERKTIIKVIRTTFLKMYHLNDNSSNKYLL